MIRLLIAGLMVLMAGNAFAVTNEFLYQNCKIYADNAFKSNANSTAALVCGSYFRAIFQSGNLVCAWANHREKPTEKIIISAVGIGSSDENNILPVIQTYVNKMQANPSLWNDSPAGEVLLIWQEFQPCKPE